jgi:V8-like Glu-specific endopeptidase
MSIDHPVYTFTSIIKIDEKHSASGFFFLDKEHLFLITNKHVIYGKDFAEPKIKQITIILHTDASNATINEQLVIELFDAYGKRKWLEHKNPTVDVLLIPITLENKKYIITPLNRTYIEDAKEFVTLFEKIVVVGYPYGWYDDINNLPIIRIGHLSGPFKVGFKGNPWMIGDVITHPGMSGAPVLMYLVNPIKRTPEGKRAISYETRFLLIGVYSGQFQIPHKEEERPNLITIWFPELILEILDEPK